MGKLNKFALAPGSLSDVAAPGSATGGESSEEAPAPKPAKKPVVKIVKKKAAEEAVAAPAEEVTAPATASSGEISPEQAEAAVLAESEATDAQAVELDQSSIDISP